MVNFNYSVDTVSEKITKYVREVQYGRGYQAVASDDFAIGANFDRECSIVLTNLCESEATDVINLLTAVMGTVLVRMQLPGDSIPLNYLISNTYSIERRRGKIVGITINAKQVT